MRMIKKKYPWGPIAIYQINDKGQRCGITKTFDSIGKSDWIYQVKKDDDHGIQIKFKYSDILSVETKI